MLYGMEADPNVLSSWFLCSLPSSLSALVYLDGACLGSYVGGPVSSARGSTMIAKPMSTAAVVYAAIFLFMVCSCLFLRHIVLVWCGSFKAMF